jgi:phosphate transport system substrate-binding protein
VTQTEGHELGRRALLGGTTGLFCSVAGCTASGGGGSEATATATPTASLSGQVDVAGSSTVYPLTLEVANRFMEAHPDVSISVSSTGTGGGFVDFFCPGRTELNGASRPISTDESDACAANDVDPVRFRVATDAVTVVVNREADWLTCLSTAELSELWRRGGAETWAAVNAAWPDEPVDLYGPSTASGTFDYFAESVLGSVEAHRTDYAGTEQDETIVQSVADSPHAMGYLGFAYYAQNRDRVSAVAVRGGDGDCVAPSLEAARTGAYQPLSRPLFVYVDRAALDRPVVRAFVASYLDAAPTSLVRDVGYVPVSEAAAAANRERLAAVVDPR